MKLIKTKDETLEENFLELHYNTIDAETIAVLDRLKSSFGYIEGTSGEKKATVALSDIFYFETVDRKTFAYTDEACVEVKEALRDIIDNHADAGFIRVSKSSVVNIYKVKKLEGDMNMRVIIYLKNDEKLIMNRSYRDEFYEALKKLQGGNGQ
ncbi:MAG: LytTR family transcriptional regulator DNA-binding domain-containing protein [Lachnospiraceae bacterium]|nr:LytTR family transcriptional regulator DNA-binding domain-containing protein [Lachnospiraceae bacterium]